MHAIFIAATWQEVAVDVGFAIGGATVAVVTALLGNRYFHTLQLKERHHEDLNQMVLRPWRKALQSRRHGLGVQGFGTYPTISYRHPACPFEFTRHRSGLATEEGPYDPPEGPLLERSREHWPSLHGQWRGYLAARGELEESVTRILEEVDGELARVNGAGEISWSFDDGEPGRGRRIFLTQIWQHLLQGHLPLERKVPIKVVNLESGAKDTPKTDMAELVLWDNSQCRGPKTAILDTATVVKKYRDGPASRQQFMSVLEEAEKLFHSHVEPLYAEFDRLEHDRNLAGTCEYCPRIFR